MHFLSVFLNIMIINIDMFCMYTTSSVFKNMNSTKTVNIDDYR